MESEWNQLVGARLDAKRIFYGVAERHQFEKRTLSRREPGRPQVCTMCGDKFGPEQFDPDYPKNVCPNLANAAKACMALGCTDMELAMLWSGHGLPKP